MSTTLLVVLLELLLEEKTKDIPEMSATLYMDLTRDIIMDAQNGGARRREDRLVGGSIVISVI